MERRFHFDFQGQGTSPDRREHFFGRLYRAHGPAVLLSLERVDIHRQFRRADHLGQKHKPPALHLRTVREVQVFRQRIVLPAAGVRDGRTPPDPAVPLKLKKAPDRLRAVCSIRKCPSRKMDWIQVSSEYFSFKCPHRVCTIPTPESWNQEAFASRNSREGQSPRQKWPGIPPSPG